MSNTMQPGREVTLSPNRSETVKEHIMDWATIGRALVFLKRRQVHTVIVSMPNPNRQTIVKRPRGDGPTGLNCLLVEYLDAQSAIQLDALPPTCLDSGQISGHVSSSQSWMGRWCCAKRESWKRGLPCHSIRRGYALVQAASKYGAPGSSERLDTRTSLPGKLAAPMTPHSDPPDCTTSEGRLGSPRGLLRRSRAARGASFLVTIASPTTFGGVSKKNAPSQTWFWDLRSNTMICNV